MPNPAWAVDLALSQTNTWIGFQALGSWSHPFNPDHVDNTTNGTPADGIRFGLETYGSTYFELYVSDVDYSAYRTELENWSAVLAPPEPRFLSEAFTPDRSAFRLSWSSVSNAAYQVEFSPNLAAWSNASAAVTATSALTSWSDTGAGTGAGPAAQARRFYRVRAGN
jgi:hypothetical protein